MKEVFWKFIDIRVLRGIVMKRKVNLFYRIWKRTDKGRGKNQNTRQRKEHNKCISES